MKSSAEPNNNLPFYKPKCKELRQTLFNKTFFSQESENAFHVEFDCECTLLLTRLMRAHNSGKDVNDEVPSSIQTHHDPTQNSC